MRMKRKIHERKMCIYILKCEKTTRFFKYNTSSIKGVKWPSTSFKKRRRKRLKAVSRQVYAAQNTQRHVKYKAASWIILGAPGATGCGVRTVRGAIIAPCAVRRLKREFLGHGRVFQCLICPSIVTRSVVCTYLSYNLCKSRDAAGGPLSLSPNTERERGLARSGLAGRKKQPAAWGSCGLRRRSVDAPVRGAPFCTLHGSLPAMLEKMIWLTSLQKCADLFLFYYFVLYTF